MSHLTEETKKKLAKKENVVAVGTGKEEKNGERTGNDAAVAFVKKKKPVSEISADSVIPEKVDGVRTDVIEIGEVGIENEYPVRPGQIETETRDIETNQKHRPFPQGSSIGHPDITAGTAGLVMWRRAEKEVGDQTLVYPEPVGVSNNHVIANSNKAEVGDVILQPGPYDGGKEIDDKYTVGQLEGYVDIEKEDNLFDIGWYSLKDERIANSFVLGMGVPTEKATVEKGDLAKKGNTRTTGYREGEVLSTDARVNVKFPDEIKEFEDQIITRSISRGGDSGSAVFNKHGEIIGVLNAGSSKVTIVNKIDNILGNTPLSLNMEDVYDE